jgi:hypothetical protein
MKGGLSVRQGWRDTLVSATPGVQLELGGEWSRRRPGHVVGRWASSSFAATKLIATAYPSLARREARGARREAQRAGSCPLTRLSRLR